MSFDNERLAAIYDVDNPDGPDHDYFRALVERLGARTVVDLGCGTGILTVTLSTSTRSVVGIDPSAAMLARAKARPGGDGVEWRLGTSELIEPASTDIVIMSGNVAMHILGDDWHRTLAHIERGLRPGGYLAFETRNPLTKAWENWNEPLTERETPVGRLRDSVSTDPPDDAGIVTMHCYNEFANDGAVVTFDQQLQFRSLEQVTADLSYAELRVVNMWRDWQGTPFTNTAQEPLMVVEAVKPL